MNYGTSYLSKVYNYLIWSFSPFWIWKLFCIFIISFDQINLDVAWCNLRWERHCSSRSFRNICDRYSVFYVPVTFTVHSDEMQGKPLAWLHTGNWRCLASSSSGLSVFIDVKKTNNISIILLRGKTFCPAITEDSFSLY